MRCGHLFNGIGGFALAAHWMGWNNIMHCEIDSFCNKVMNYHFPKSYQHEDIRTTDFTIWRGKFDLITGGFPCQPYSTAGKRKGKDDDRHLWPEMLRAIREIRPGWIVGENVRGLTNWNGGLVFDEVQVDLEAEGYEVLPFLLPAAGVGAPHRRDRIWFIAHANNLYGRTRARRQNGEEVGYNRESIIADANSNGFSRDNQIEKDRRQEKTDERKEQWEERDEAQRERLRADIGRNDAKGIIADANICQRCKGRLHQERSETATGYACSFHTRYDRTDWQDFPTQSPVCNRNDGISIRLADWPVPSRKGIRILKGKQAYGRWRRESIKALGNAIVPQAAFQIFKAIEQWQLNQP